MCMKEIYVLCEGKRESVCVREKIEKRKKIYIYIYVCVCVCKRERESGVAVCSLLDVSS